MYHLEIFFFCPFETQQSSARRVSIAAIPRSSGGNNMQFDMVGTTTVTTGISDRRVFGLHCCQMHLQKRNKVNPYKYITDSIFLSLSHVQYTIHSSYSSTKWLLHIASRAGANATDGRCGISNFICFLILCLLRATVKNTGLLRGRSRATNPPISVVCICTRDLLEALELFFSSSRKACWKWDEMTEGQFARERSQHDAIVQNQQSVFAPATRLFLWCFSFSYFVLLWRWFPGMWQGRAQCARR